MNYMQLLKKVQNLETLKISKRKIDRWNGKPVHLRRPLCCRLKIVINSPQFFLGVEGYRQPRPHKLCLELLVAPTMPKLHTHTHTKERHLNNVIINSLWDWRNTPVWRKIIQYMILSVLTKHLSPGWYWILAAKHWSCCSWAE